MASQLENGLCFYEQNSIMNSVRVDYWTAELAELAII